MTVNSMRLQVAKLFNSKCFVCHKAIGTGRGFTYHHLWYQNTEKRYKHFKTQKEYYEYLIPKIRENPKRFLLVCNAHHQATERLHRYSADKRKRLYEAACRTRT